MNARRSLTTCLLRFGFCAAALVVAGFALYPNLQLPEPALTRGFTDKIYHVVGCMTLVLLAATGWRVPIWALCLALPLSIGLEFIQGVAPGRGVHVTDMIANLGGVSLALLFLALGAGRERTGRK
ncbi:MAG: hypothetical protein ACR2QH_04425 [Geminicoccaceae bacterium]